MTTADRIAADIAGLRPVAADLSFADAYEVRRGGVSVTDSRGNRTTTEATVESGRCRLKAGGLQPGEREVAGQLQIERPYAIDLPLTTLATERDRLRINGARLFEIRGVLRAGAFAVFATAICEER